MDKQAKIGSLLLWIGVAAVLLGGVGGGQVGGAVMLGGVPFFLIGYWLQTRHEPKRRSISAEPIRMKTYKRDNLSSTWESRRLLLALVLFMCILFLTPYFYQQLYPPPPQVVPAGTATAVEPTSSCIEAFAAAARVRADQDTHEDLFPAYSACMSLEEWKSADALYPTAIDGVDPIRYAMTVCANNQEELRETPICRAVNAPPAADASSIKASGRTGLLGAPLPEGAQLTEQTPGNRAAGRDPTESYAISATAVDIAAFFNQAMPGSGWYKDGTSTETVLFFQKGNLILGVLIGGDGGSFTLMGS